MGKAGKNTQTLTAFFDELPDAAAERIESVSMGPGPAYAKAVRARAPQATICFDPFYGDLRVMLISALTALVSTVPALPEVGMIRRSGDPVISTGVLERSRPCTAFPIRRESGSLGR